MASISLSDAGEDFQRELIEPGLYLAICYQMIQIGTVPTTWEGKDKETPKIRIGWEIPEVRVTFKPENGPQIRVISKEFTAMLGENANLRKTLKSWRGVDFTPEELKKFELTNLLGKACMLNIGHKVSDKNGKTYEEITAVTRVPKGMPVPAQETPTMLLAYDDFDYSVYEQLPTFLKEKIQTSKEFKKLQSPAELQSDLSMNPVTSAGFVDTLESDEPLPF